MIESDIFWANEKCKTLDKLYSTKDRLEMLYQWTKTDAVNKEQFLYILQHIVGEW